MKKLIFVLTILVACTFLVIGCSSSSTTPSTAPSAVAPSSTGTPVSGGILRQISNMGPRELSYYPEFGPGEEVGILPAAEKLCEFNSKGETAPLLSDSYDLGKDSAGLQTLTFHIKKGIKFTDGSDLNAQVAAWNYQLARDSGRMQYAALLKTIEVVDDYTMTLHMTTWNPLMINSYGWVPLFSKAAWDKAGGGDQDKSKKWAYNNIVATGPFMLKEFQPDDHLTWIKNPNYWQKGKPYLDEIDVKYIPNSVTASQMMQAGQADEWDGAEDQYQADLVNKGFVRQTVQGMGMTQVIVPNNKDPNSKWNNKALREALEYAIDKASIAKSLGYGFAVPATGLGGPGTWGYLATDERPYNPDKAKQLLTQAGYPSGLKITLLCISGAGGRNTLAEAVKGYLDAAGFQTNLDVADVGRFMTAAWNTGWDDLLLQWYGNDKPNFLNAFQRQVGKYPMSKWASRSVPPDLAALNDESLTKTTAADMQAISQKLAQYIEDEALLTPIDFDPSAYIIKPYLHTTYLQQSQVTREYYNEWMDKH